MYKRDLSKPLASTYGDPPFTSKKDKFIGPRNLNKKKVSELKSKIASLENGFNTEERRYRARGNADFSVGMRRYSEEATKLNKKLIKLTGKGSSFYESKRKK